MTLSYTNHQHMLNTKHAKWVEFLQSFTFYYKYKSGKENVAVDTLLMRYVLLLVLEVKISTSHFIKALYIEEEDFKKVVEDPSLFTLSPYKKVCF